MKKFLYILGTIVAIIAILHIIAPKNYKVSRTIEVNQSIEFVFKSLCSLEEQQIWSPWAELDPKMKVEYKGENGHVGSIIHWIGNDDVGEGEQEIIKIVPYQYIETELRFLKPFESKSNGFFQLKQIDNGTSVTWGFKGDYKFPFTVMMLFMNMEESISKDFEKGLNKFKTYIEKK